MNCTQAAECISALFDSQSISRDLAAHLADCPECRAQLNEYAEMSAELRDLASASGPQAIPEGRWRLAEPAAANNWVRRWRGTMRIPRLAFALMLIALLALSTGLFLTRATGTYRWFQYELVGRDGKRIMNGIAPVNPEGNPYYDVEAGMKYPEGSVWFCLRVVGQVGEAERIGARTMWHPRTEPFGEGFFKRLRSMPEREFLYFPGQDLKIPVDGYGDLEIKGHFEATLPEDVRMGRFPEDGKFRIDLPLVMFREKQMLMHMKEDMEAGQVSMDRSYFACGEQGKGWYVFSSKAFKGAMEGTLTGSRIEFELDGQQYFLFASQPIIFGSVKIWVKHFDAVRDFDPTSPGMMDSGQNGPTLVFGELKNLVVDK